MARLKPLVLGAVGSALVFANGCTNALVFTTSTVTAIDINAVENGQQTLTVGYKRFEGVVMPVREDKDTCVTCDHRPVRKRAYSVISALRYDTGGLLPENLGGNDVNGTHIKSVFATGNAAKVQTAAESMMGFFEAYEGDLITPEGKFLLDEIGVTLERLDAAKRAEAETAILEHYLRRPSQQRYAIRMIQNETNTPTLLAMLEDAKKAVGDSSAESPTDEESADPGAALIDFVANADDQATDTEGKTQLDKVLDAIGPHLPGPEKPLSELTNAEMARTLVQESAQANDVEDLRESLRRVNSIAQA